MWMFLSLCISVCQMYAVPQRPEEGSRSLEAGVTGCCKLPSVHWELNSRPLQEQYTLLIPTHPRSPFVLVWETGSHRALNSTAVLMMAFSFWFPSLYLLSDGITSMKHHSWLWHTGFQPRPFCKLGRHSNWATPSAQSFVNNLQCPRSFIHLP